MEAVASAMRGREPGVPVALAFLDFLEPNLSGAVGSLYATGIRQLSIVPVFLSAGGHVLKDLPEQARQLQQSFPDLAIVIAGAIGMQPAVIEAMAAFALDTVPGRPRPGENGATPERQGSGDADV